MNTPSEGEAAQGASPVPWARVTDRKVRVLLLGNGNRANIQAEAERLRPIILQHAEIVVSDFRQTEDLLDLTADFAVVLGGDGSILHAVQQLGHRQIPVLGVNLGKLGFLAALSPDQFVRAFPGVCAGNCQIIDHLMLACTILRDGKTIHRQLGLNEMAILGGPPFTMIDIDLYVDSVLATTYSCDGLIISTPVGSTAHNLSAGGPILRKSLQAFVISPISPHTLTVRPVVDRADRVYEAVVQQPRASASVVVDGRVVCELEPHDRVCVCRAESQFHMVEVGGQHYYQTLREKLGWRGHIRR